MSSVDPDKLSLGMVKLEWTPDGGAKRDLGYIRAASIEPVLAFLQHYNARGGMRVMDKEIVTQKEIRIPATFEEVSVENLAAFFGGGTPTAGKFSVLTDPIREGALDLTFEPTDAPKPYQKVVWAIAKARLKANGAFGFNDADWIGADILIEVLYDGANPTKPYGEMTVSTVS